MNEQEYFEAFALNLKKLRKKVKKTQMDVAIDAEMSLSYYSGLEQGKQNPTLKQLRRLAEVLDCEVKNLVKFKTLAPKAKVIAKKRVIKKRSSK